MSSEGFLGTAATLRADIVLLLEVTMGAGLLIGARLARRRRFREHALCQSIIVLLNLPVIAAAMIPSFHAQVLPRIPTRLGKAYYGLATAHGVFGVAAEITAIYILLSVKTRLLPVTFRMTAYRPWMRGAVVLWWIAVVLGIATYARWYAPRLW